jgi:hypothetical protein
MIAIRCRDCNKELISSGNHTQCCGCENMMTIDGDKVTAVDLSRVVMINSEETNKNKNLLSSQDLSFQEERRKRKVRKLDFEIR